MIQALVADKLMDKMLDGTLKPKGLAKHGSALKLDAPEGPSAALATPAPPAPDLDNKPKTP